MLVRFCRTKCSPWSQAHTDMFTFLCKSLVFVFDLLRPLAMSHMVVHMTAQLITAKRHLFSSCWFSAHRWAEELKALKGTDTLTHTVRLLWFCVGCCLVVSTDWTPNNINCDRRVFTWCQVFQTGQLKIWKTLPNPIFSCPVWVSLFLVELQIPDVG